MDLRIAPRAILLAMLAAPDHVWSIGTTAAVMGFSPSGTVTETAGTLSAEAGPARMRISAQVRLLAFETIAAAATGWTQGIALCVPTPARRRPGPIHRLNADPGAIRAQDTAMPVFDMGLGDAAVRVLFRPTPDSLTATLALCGQGWEAVPPTLAGTWITETTIARIERDAPAGPPPVMIVGGARHARTTPLPAGYSPVAHIFPPHPQQPQPGAATRHAAFQAQLAAFGRPDLWQLKQRVLSLLHARQFEDIATDRHGTAQIRTTLRQHLFLTGTPPPDDWMRRYDRPLDLACRAN